MLCISLAGDVIADILIALSLCISLEWSRTGWKKTDSVINTLMIYSINTGLLTSICATGCLVSYVIQPLGLITIAIYYLLGKLSFNGLLGMLNARDSLHEKHSGVLEMKPVESSTSDGYPPVASCYTLTAI
ncbi:hypothetical protein L208DRAFT_1360199 [Tricholoma matsutake]|nr:hypothetical protein L208DRAFT_1360199 [Tricholoma matsutake 945]